MLIKNNNDQCHCNYIPILFSEVNDAKICYCSNKEKADCLNEYFISVSTVDASNTQLPPFSPRKESILPNFTIQSQEVKDILANLILNKATGPDEFSHRILKETRKSICYPLVYFLIYHSMKAYIPVPGNLKCYAHF
jgi:hypothetical protein